MKEIEMTFITELKDKEIELLWKQNICLDDWDYMIVVPIDVLYESNLEPKEYCLSRLLTGCCSNTWYKANFRGKTVGMGIAYHS